MSIVAQKTFFKQHEAGDHKRGGEHMFIEASYCTLYSILLWQLTPELLLNGGSLIASFLFFMMSCGTSC
jgi:hypothetical protein